MQKSFCLLLFLVCFLHLLAFSQAEKPKGDSLNKVDEMGKKHGLWVNNFPARKGEKPYSEYGNYEHGMKYGTWHKLSKDGELIAIENFKNNLLDGDAQYYDLGKLYCEGSYASRSSAQEKDTIVITDPETHLESYKEIPAYYGSFRQGEWRYYDPKTGVLIKVEEYAEDELIHKRNFPDYFSDSTAFKKREALLPHNQSKKFSFFNYPKKKNSLIR